MTFQEFVDSVEALAPIGMKQTYISTASPIVYYEYTDSDGDSLEIRIELFQPKGKRILVFAYSGDCWYFSTAFSMWLATVAELAENFEG